MSCASEHANRFDPPLQQSASKRKRSLPGTPDPNAEVIALSPRTLMATNRFICEVCSKGFQRDQNLQLHRRGHNLPWRLKQREEQDIKKRVYVCPEASCVHHDPARALGDLTGIKKHFFRKHGDKKWKCDRCSKRYAVQSDWKAHQKVCGTREYRCGCGVLFSRRDSFITHRAFCDALAEETAKVSATCQDGNQQCSKPDQNGGLVTGLASGAEGSSPSLSHRTTGLASDSRFMSAPPTKGCSRNGSDTEDSGVEFLSSRISAGSNTYGQSKVPALSLRLGTGPGPGPPILSLQTLGCFPDADNMLSMRREMIVGSSCSDAMHWPTYSSGPGTFASLLEMPNSDPEPWKEYSSACASTDSWLKPSSAGELTCQSVVGVVRSAVDEDPFTKSMGLSQFSPPFSSVTPSLSFLQNSCMPSITPSTYHQPRHHGNPHLPATALLQKAAMMGPTSSTSLFHDRGGGLQYPVTGESAPPEPFWGFNDLSSGSMWQSSLNQKASREGHTNAIESYRSSERREDTACLPSSQNEGGLQGYFKSHCTSGTSVLATAGNSLAAGESIYVQGDDMSFHQVGLPEQLLRGSSCNPDNGYEFARPTNSTLKANMEGGQTTLDFLGVEGMAAGMVRPLSERDSLPAFSH